MPTPLPHRTLNDLPAKARSAMVGVLGTVLADGLDLSSQIKQAHWNVKGPNFISLHELFDKVVHEINEQIDDVAERMVQLGGVAHGTVRHAAKASRLKEYPPAIFSGREHVRAVSGALAEFGKRVRSAIDAADKAGDKDTADLFTGLSRAVDKGLWLVEAHGHARD